MGRITDFLDHLVGRVSPIPPDLAGLGTDLGHSQEQFAPDKYGNYTATSNDFYSAAMLRAKSQSKLDMRFYDSKGETVEGSDVERLLQHVNPFWTRRRLTVQYQLSMATWGQCYFFVEKNNAGVPRELWWAKPSRVKPVISASDYIKGFVYTPASGAEPIKFGTDETIWFRYPNVIDEFTGLAPLAAARMAADYSSAAMQANARMFDNGLMMGGAFMPPKDTELTEIQAKDLEKQLDKRFRGVDKAHRWAVFRHDFRFVEMGVNPKDAEFVDGMNMSFRQVCRALGVPSQLLNDAEYATLANVSEYERQLWEHTMEFEASFYAEELIEQLLPMFRATKIVSMEYDLDKIAALQEDKKLREEREASQIKDGRLTINEWRTRNNMDTVSWGDTWWKHALFVPAEDYELATDADEAARSLGRGTRATDPYVSDEARFAKTVRSLMARQLDAVISTLNRTIEDALTEPFNMARWVAEYQRGSEPLLMATISKSSLLGASEIGIDLSDDLAEIDGLADAVTERAAVTSAQFARGVNETLWNELRTVIGDGFDVGDGVDALTVRIHGVLGRDAAEWKARRIAQTETTKSVSWGEMEVWRRSDVAEKMWITQGDDAVRASHAALNNVKIRIGDMFQVGSCLGDAPGLTGCASEDLNCRCRLKPVTKQQSGVASGLRKLVDALEIS